MTWCRWCWSASEVLCVTAGEEILAGRDTLPGVSRLSEPGAGGCPARYLLCEGACTRIPVTWEHRLDPAHS